MAANAIEASLKQPVEAAVPEGVPPTLLAVQERNRRVRDTGCLHLHRDLTSWPGGGER